jgi:hypothetical protein
MSRSHGVGVIGRDEPLQDFAAGGGGRAGGAEDVLDGDGHTQQRAIFAGGATAVGGGGLLQRQLCGDRFAEPQLCQLGDVADFIDRQVHRQTPDNKKRRGAFLPRRWANWSSLKMRRGGATTPVQLHLARGTRLAAAACTAAHAAAARLAERRRLITCVPDWQISYNCAGV